MIENEISRRASVLVGFFSSPVPIRLYCASRMDIFLKGSTLCVTDAGKLPASIEVSPWRLLLNRIDHRLGSVCARFCF